MKSIAASIILCCALGSAASAATTQNLEMSVGQWTILEINNVDSINFVAKPTNVDASFSFGYAFSQNGCGPDPWSCMPEGQETNVVKTGNSPNFPNGWLGITYRGSVTDPFSISYQKDGAEKLYMFFHVTSGNGTLSQIGDDVESPAPVPLPAAGLMLVAGLASVGGLGVLKRQRSKTKA